MIPGASVFGPFFSRRSSYHMPWNSLEQLFFVAWVIRHSFSCGCCLQHMQLHRCVTWPLRIINADAACTANSQQLALITRKNCENGQLLVVFVALMDRVLG